MKKIQHFLFVNLLLICVFSLSHTYAYASGGNAGSNAPASNINETRSVSSFSEIEVFSAIDVIYTVGNKTTVSVTAPQSIMPYVRTEVKGKTLRCYIKNEGVNNVDNDRKVVMNITAPALDSFEISGASSVTVTNDLTGTHELEIDITGAGNMKAGDVKTSKLEIELSGAANLDIKSATASKTDIDLSGAANMEIGNIATNNMEFESSGAAKSGISGKAQYCSIDVSGASSTNLSGLIFADGSLEASGASKLTINKKSALSIMETSGAATVTKK